MGGRLRQGSDSRSKDIDVKAYYQWVPFMLFLQSLMFYVPHLIYKRFEGGKIKVRSGGSRRLLLSVQCLHSANIQWNLL